MTDRNTFPVMVVVVLASSMVFIDGTAFNVALPALQESLDASGLDLLAIVNAYALFLTSLLLLGGALGDRVGRKRVFGAGIAVFSAASLLCGLAPETRFLIAARALQGIGAAFMVPGSLSLISVTFSKEHRAQAIGVWSACTVVVTAVGPFLGGVLADAGLWRGVFFLNLPLAAVALVLLAKYVPESRDANAQGALDLRGAVTATLGLLGINYGLLEFSAPEGDAIVAAGALAAGVVFVSAFFWIEARSTSPLLPLGLFRSRAFLGANLVTLCLYLGFNGLLLFLPMNLIQVQGYSAAIAGLAQLPVIGSLAVIAPWSGRLADCAGPRLPIVIGSVLAALGFAAAGLPEVTNGPSDYCWSYFPALTLLGIGMALMIPALSATVVSAAPMDQAGLASGINSAVARLASVLATPLLGGLMMITFASSFESRCAALDLTDADRTALRKSAVRLGHALSSAEVSADVRSTTQNAQALALIDAFRSVCVGATCFACVGVLLGAMLIPRTGISKRGD
jgi:EmrB/QacA subfamily drug resistance transporter